MPPGPGFLGGLSLAQLDVVDQRAAVTSGDRLGRGLVCDQGCKKSIKASARPVGQPDHIGR